MQKKKSLSSTSSIRTVSYVGKPIVRYPNLVWKEVEELLDGKPSNTSV